MWYKVEKYADGYEEAIVFLTEEEAAVVKRFLDEVEKQSDPRAWPGGIWYLNGPHESEEAANRAPQM